MGPGGAEKRGKLAGRDEEEAVEYEPPVPVADPAELVTDAAVLHEHLRNVSVLAEVPREARHPQDLQVANDPEQHANHEEHGGAVYPGRHLQRARRGRPPRRREGPVGAVPEHLGAGLLVRAVIVRFDCV